MQAGVGLLVSDVMPIYMIIPRYSHNYAQFCQLLNSNLFTHRRIFMLLREATSETYGPRVSFSSYQSRSLYYCFAIYFAFTFYFASLYQKYQKYYLSDLTPVSDREGIDNPNRVGCVELLLLCRYEGLACSLLLD